MATDHPTLPPLPRQGRSRLFWLLVVVATLLALWLLASAWLLVSAARSAAKGRNAVEAARAELTIQQLLDPDGDRRLWIAQKHLERADDRANSPLLVPLKLLPFAGRQLRSFGALASASSDGLGVGLDALDRAQQILEEGVPSGPARITVLRELTTVLDAAKSRIDRLDLGPDDALVGPLGDARRSLTDGIADVRRALLRGEEVTDGLAQMMEDSRYLVLVTNNAEMRAGSGMVLQVGTLRASRGELTLETIHSSSDVNPPLGTVPVTGDLAARWGFLHPDDFRNVNLSPRFDRSAELAMQLWSAGGGVPVDGVLALDPFALQAVLEATGPVAVGDTDVGADTALDLLFHDQYLGEAADDPERYEQLGRIAEATLEALSSSDVDAGVLAEELAGAARGRHILAWSPEEEMQAAWEAAEVAGSLEPDSLLLSIINRGANKLDYFVDAEADIGAEVVGSELEVTVRVVVTNHIEPGEPAYIAGPNRGLDLAYGEYRGYIALNVPGAATDGGIDGVDTLAVAGADGPTRVLATRFQLAPGATHEVTFRFRLPREDATLRVEPSARARRVTFRFGELEWDDEEPVTLDLGA